MSDQQMPPGKPGRRVAGQARQQGELLHAILRRGLAAAVVSGIGLAGVATFAVSSNNAASMAFALHSPLSVSSIDTAPEVSAAELAQQRSQAMDADADAITAAAGDAASQQHFAGMSADATAINAENKRLKTLAHFIWPATGKVGSVFGMRMHPILHVLRMHDGDDIGGTCGEPIWAAQSGTVISTAMGYNGGSGNNVWIEHGDINGVDVQSGYLHMKDYIVTVGQKVNQGDVIGYVGTTGLSTGCHLHFSIKKNGVESNPMEYIGWNPEAKGAPTHN